MKEKEPFQVSKLIRRIIDYVLVPTFLKFTYIEDEIRERLIMHSKDFKKNKKKDKEETDFYLIKINKKNFNIKLSHLFRELNKSELKLAPASDLELVLFHPPLKKSLYHIFFGMRIIILERPEVSRHGIPVYLAGDNGIFTNRIDYVPELLLFSSRRPLYVLAKAVKISKVSHEEIMN